MRVVFAIALLIALLPLPASAAPGSIVTVSAGPSGYLYTVDGRPEPIRGMGYNAMLADRSDDERAAHLSRDFALMKRVGINTVLGWDMRTFDGVMLDVAAASGLGVIMHFELGKGWDYADPALQEQLLREIGDWVVAYRDHPAVRMWGVGNEVLLTTSDDECRAFARFFARVFQLVRGLDPNHPVTYREAEDVRVPFFREAFAEAQIPLDGFVFGMNFYTPRVEEVLADWPAHQFDVPVFVSEFAPAGWSPSERARGFQDMWARVLAYERFALGAAPYVWSTEGPEAVDRIFGLTDEQGRPVDETLAELQRLYRGANAAAEPLPEPAHSSVAASSDLNIEAAQAQLLARALALGDLEPIDLDAARTEAWAHYRADLESSAPGYESADPARIDRMLDLLSGTAVLAGLRRAEQPVYSGAVEALPLLAGMARWSAADPRAQAVAEAFLSEVLAQALRAG
jgi:hypothetical protein